MSSSFEVARKPGGKSLKVKTTSASVSLGVLVAVATGVLVAVAVGVAVLVGLAKSVRVAVGAAADLVVGVNVGARVAATSRFEESTP